jgi:hypothetical protein
LKLAGWNMQRCVDIIVGEHKAGRDNRLQNVIYNRKIASASWGWTWRDYTGASPHTEHGHFSARYGSGSGTGNPENDTSPWGLLAAYEKENSMSAAEVSEIKAAITAAKQEILKAIDAIPADLLATKYQPNSTVYPNRTIGNYFGDTHPVRDYETGLGTVDPKQAPKEGSFLNIVGGVPATLEGIKDRLGSIEARLDEVVPPVDPAS